MFLYYYYYYPNTSPPDLVKSAPPSYVLPDTGLTLIFLVRKSSDAKSFIKSLELIILSSSSSSAITSSSCLHTMFAILSNSYTMLYYFFIYSVSLSDKSKLFKKLLSIFYNTFFDHPYT
jgi:hypothetical protein